MAVRPLTCPYSRRSVPPAVSWFLWFCLAALLVLPVVAVLAEDRPPRNEITDEQDPGDGAKGSDDAEVRAAA